MNNNRFLASVALVLVVLAVGFLVLRNSATNNSNKIKVATSFYPLYFFTSQIGGDKVEVTNITPPGAEPHDYDPSTGDIVKIEKSKLLVLNGGVEAWGDKI